MVFLIARKEFLNNLLTARFVIGFILCLVLIPFSILLNIGNYRDMMSQYKIDRDAAEKSVKENRVYSGLRPEVVIPPEPLSIFSNGISGQVGNRARILLGTKPMLASGKTAAGDNPFLSSFFSIDFVGIAAIIFSLLALLFSYDAFTREKEDGTLKLQMSNPLGRARLLAGKVFGILLTLLPILAFCYLLAAVLILFSHDLVFSGFEWGRIAFLFTVSLLYLSVFVIIGALVSAQSRTSVTSLVLCLFVWVFLVFIVPNLSANFAESFVRVQSRDNLDRVLRDMDREYERKTFEGYTSQAIPDDSMTHWWLNGGDDGYKEMYASSRVFEIERRRAMISEPLRIEYADKKWASQKAYLDSLTHQARVAEKISLVSPTGVFRTIASAICATDLRPYANEMDRIRQYRETFIRYLQNKDIFASFRWLTPVPPESFLTDDEIVEKRTGGEFKTSKAFWAWAAQLKDASAYSQKLKNKIPGSQQNDYPFLDIADMPRFPERPKASLSGLADSVADIGLLFVEIVFLFYLSYVAFIRYDVR
jgi:ABC-type transport system involved in multi-copper enzyme maturation permease subunit